MNRKLAFLVATLALSSSNLMAQEADQDRGFLCDVFGINCPEPVVTDQQAGDSTLGREDSSSAAPTAAPAGGGSGAPAAGPDDDQDDEPAAGPDDDQDDDAGPAPAPAPDPERLDSLRQQAENLVQQHFEKRSQALETRNKEGFVEDIGAERMKLILEQSKSIPRIKELQDETELQKIIDNTKTKNQALDKKAGRIPVEAENPAQVEKAEEKDPVVNAPPKPDEEQQLILQSDDEEDENENEGEGEQ